MLTAYWDTDVYHQRFNHTVTLLSVGCCGASVIEVWSQFGRIMKRGRDDGQKTVLRILVANELGSLKCDFPLPSFCPFLGLDLPHIFLVCQFMLAFSLKHDPQFWKLVKACYLYKTSSDCFCRACCSLFRYSSMTHLVVCFSISVLLQCTHSPCLSNGVDNLRNSTVTYASSATQIMLSNTGTTLQFFTRVLKWTQSSPFLSTFSTFSAN